MTTKIFSYNVNGIRAAIKKGLIDWMKNSNPDILCVQETKAQPNQIDNSVFEELGYNCYWFSAEKKGYSGVGIISKQVPNHVEYGMNNIKYDKEGRLMRADFGDISVISVYHPSGSNADRQSFKIQWLKDFYNYIKELKKERKKLIISGDFNICRLWIDIHNPEKQQKTSGFLPEEREWFQKFIDNGFTDSFRIFNKEPHNYSWWSYRAGARQRNKGWRIDYNMLSSDIADKAINAEIHQNAMQSDHCPVSVEINGLDKNSLY